jgi:hypothetical protein
MKSFVAFRIVHALNQRDSQSKEPVRLVSDAANGLTWIQAHGTGESKRAETERFELSVPLRVLHLSRVVH